MTKLILLTATLLISACSNSDFSQFKSDFMGSCESSGGTDYVCNCVFDKLEAKYGEDRIAHFQRTQNPPVDFLEVTMQSRMECIK